MNVHIILSILCIAVITCKVVSQCTSINDNLSNEGNHHIISQSISNQIIFMPFYKITCQGRVRQWKVQIDGRGTDSMNITFTVWKHSTTSSSRFALVGKNTLTLNNVHNVTTYELTPSLEDQIDVEPGFVIGVYVGRAIGPTSGINAIGIEPNEQYSTYFVNSDEIQDVDGFLDVAMASVISFNQIPLVVAEIVDKSVISSTTTTSMLPSIEQTAISPSPSIKLPSPSITNAISIEQSSSTNIVISNSQSVTADLSASSSALPSESPIAENGGMSDIFIGPVVAITVLTIIIIIGTLIFSIMMYCTVKRRQKSKIAVENPTYDADKRRSLSNQYNFQFSRNPSYSPATLDYHKLRKKVISEHVYESCYDPYEYLEPVKLTINDIPIANSLPVKSSNKVSAIYEIPFGLSLDQSDSSKRPCGVNNLYLTASNLVQTVPVSPGYDVPVCPDLPEEKGKESLEESAQYKEPGWIYNST